MQWKVLFSDACAYITQYLKETASEDVDTYKRAKNIIAREKLECVDQKNVPVENEEINDMITAMENAQIAESTEDENEEEGKYHVDSSAENERKDITNSPADNEGKDLTNPRAEDEGKEPVNSSAEDEGTEPEGVSKTSQKKSKNKKRSKKHK